jgi:hypothetical protein
MRNLLVQAVPFSEKILSQAQDDVLTEGFRMRGFKVFLSSYLAEQSQPARNCAFHCA